MVRLLVLLIQGYQRYISRWLPPRCRFHPTCSNYAISALQQHGLVRGATLAGGRILRCHPLNPGGLDPVPPPRSDRPR